MFILSETIHLYLLSYALEPNFGNYRENNLIQRTSLSIFSGDFEPQNVNGFFERIHFF